MGNQRCCSPLLSLSTHFLTSQTAKLKNYFLQLCDLLRKMKSFTFWRITMKRILLALMILMTSLSAVAHDNECNFSLDYNININDETIRFANDKNKTIVFSSDQIEVNGEKLVLTAEQQENSKEFQQRTRAIVPKIAEVAIEGAEIGVKAATLAVTALFGENQDVHKDLIQPIERISDKIKANINEKMINVETLENSFDNEFEQEIESLVAKAMSKYSGKLLGQIMGSIFSGDDEEIKDFEFRMENLEHDIETYVESQAKSLETKAEKLCEEMNILSELDDTLAEIDGFPELGVISLDVHEGMKFTSIKFD